MRIVAEYSFNNGAEEVRKRYPHLLAEIEEVLTSINALEHKTKKSKEKTKKLRMLFNPKALNKVFKAEFEDRGWHAKKEYCNYSTDFYVKDLSTGQKLSNLSKRNLLEAIRKIA